MPDSDDEPHASDANTRDLTCTEVDCNDALRELEVFLDGELADHTRQAIHTHLDGCPHCLEAFDFHAELRTVIAAKCRKDDMPKGLLRKIELCFGNVERDDGVVGSP
ncbi:MAG: mycothiol system anti-sigma-R factor [Ilumatobacteraceae bacterium]